MTASQIRGLPVVTVHSGEDVAEVRDVIYSPQSGRLVGVTLNKRGFFAGRSRDVLPAEAIHAVGQDAVMVLDESSIVASGDAPDDVGHPAMERDVLGDDVLTEGGSSLGKVADLVLLVGSSGEVVGYQIDKAGGGSGATSRCRNSFPSQGMRWWSRISPRSSSKTISSASVLRSTSSGPG